MEVQSLQKFYDLFIVGTLLILNSIINDTDSQNQQVKKNSQVFYEAIDNKQLDVTKFGDLIRKVFTFLSKNIRYLKRKDPKLFTLKELKENREVKITILPGIDLEEAYKNFNDELKNNLWKYLKVIYFASMKMIYSVNGNIDESTVKFSESIQKEISEKEIFDEFYTKIPNSKLFKKNETFNPFVGVGENLNGNYGIDELKSGPELLEGQTAPGIGGMAQLLGFDKMFNLDQLADQLKNIDPKEIDEATENIKQLLGGNVDEGTSEMINMMLHDITDELRKDKMSENGNPINNILKIAENVAQNMMPKLDPKKMDMSKIWQSTQNLAKNYTNQNGEKLFNGENNPLSMLTGIMEKQMNMVKNNNGQVNKNTQGDMMKDYQDIMNKMGMGNVNLTGFQKLLNSESSINKNNLSDSSISPVSSLTSQHTNNIIKKKKPKHRK